mgnify:FL=1|jgi:hypothetical protein|tara:strand:+ start:35 stop:622 length:588 start_codon:yes stop_codon:yes gene_type:complete
MATNSMQQAMLNKSRADKFLLVFDVPPILKEFSKKFNQTNSTIIPDSVQYSIFGTTVPEITVPAMENRYAGSTLYVSSHSKNPYPPVSVSFNVDNEYKNYWVLYQWLNLLHSEYEGRYNEREINTNAGDPTFKDYQTDLTIYGKDEFNNNRIKFTYTKAFPTTVNGVEYSYQNPDEITSGFTFVYSQLHTEVINF